MQLTNEASREVDEYFARQAELNQISISSVSEGAFFTVVPEVEHNWVTAVSESDSFLKRIDLDTCTSQVVNDLGPDEMALVSGRTNTEEDDRKTTSIAGVKGVRYVAEPTDHDTHISYAELNKWTRRNGARFQRLIANRRAASKGNDLLKIGWHGKSVESNTDPIKNPLGQDVNIGWIERVRKHKPEHLLDGSNITIGEGGTYKSLDALVIAMRAQIPKEKQADLELFASAEYFEDRAMKLVETQTVTERGDGSLLRAEYLLAGGIKGSTPNYFPDKTIILTNPKNLAHRTQEGSVRQAIENNHKRSRQEHFLQSNEFYAVKDYDAIIIMEGVTLKEEGA